MVEDPEEVATGREGAEEGGDEPKLPAIPVAPVLTDPPTVPPTPAVTPPAADVALAAPATLPPWPAGPMVTAVLPNPETAVRPMGDAASEASRCWVGKARAGGVGEAEGAPLPTPAAAEVGTAAVGNDELGTLPAALLLS